MKRYSRSRAAKIAAYAVLIICICLISYLISKFIYAYNSDFESVVREEYYDSNTYYDDVERALVASYNLLQIPEDAVAPQRDYYYFVYNAETHFLLANVASLGSHELSGYLYGWLEGKFSVLRVEQGSLQSLPWEENGIEDFLAAHVATLYDAPPDSSIYVLFSDALLGERQTAWENEREVLLGSAERSLALLFVIVSLIVYLALVTGRRPADELLHSGQLDRVPSDMLVVLLLITTIGGGALWSHAVEALRRQLYYTQAGLPAETLQLLSLALTIFMGLLALLSLLLFNALIRKVKAHKFWTHSLVHELACLLAMPLPVLGHTTSVLLKKTGHGTRVAFRQMFIGPDYDDDDPAEGMFRRQRRFLIITAAAVVLLIFFLLLNILSLFLLTLLAESVVVYNFLRGNQKDMVAVKKSVENSLQEQMRLEQLKVELVTNVSHDLKTPLTSIISYVELLSKEKLLSPAAYDYVQVLSEKSRRLDRIVSDLFDLAKSTSGNIPLDMEVLDLKRLFAQTLADMEDSIDASGLQLRPHLPEQPVMVLADGSRLYRVLQNVLDNALKYSLHDSRVYVELTVQQGQAIGVVKNTAAYEMNFTAEDVLRRFTRGDKARSSEGSGLGLAIAQSFCERCGGAFSVTIDGDQFKVTMEFPLYNG